MSSDKMKICHVITRMTVGGALESIFFAIQSHLQKGHEVVLITGSSQECEREFPLKIDSSRLEVVHLPSLASQPGLRNEYKEYRELLEFFRNRKFDIVNTHSPQTGIAGRTAARRAGTPVVVHTVHSLEFETGKCGWRNMFSKMSERFAARHCDKIFAAAQSIIDQSVEAKIAPRDKYMVIYRGIDTSAFVKAKRKPELRNELEIPENARVIATQAQLAPQKGYEYVVQAAARIIRKYPETHMLLIGDGPMLHGLKAQTLELGLLNHFHFAGKIPSAQIPRYLAQADLFWHLSPYEKLLRPIVQALAAGIPAIAFRVGAIPEVIENGETGYCVEPEQIDEVVKATRKLWDDPAAIRRMGETGQARVLEQFAWPHMADIIEEEYRELLANKTGR